MKWTTKDINLEFLDERIIIMKLNDDCKDLTIEGAIEGMEKLYEVASLTDVPKVIVSHPIPFYTKKEVLKHYTGTTLHESIIAIGLVSSGFVSKYVASIVIKMRERFFSDRNTDVEVKVFSDEEEAIKWLNHKLELVS